jgi:ligand-binding sensor domain-containing protein
MRWFATKDLICCVAWFYCNVTLAQLPPLQFQHLTVADGLSDNNVNDIVQDKSGFIWIATLDGLNRFDGYRVDVFTHEANNDASLCSDYINCLCVDEQAVPY